MLSNIVNNPKIWYTNIKELAENKRNFAIHLPRETLTHNSLLAHSNSSNEDSVYFKRLLDRIEFLSFSEIQRMEYLEKLCDGINILIFNSLKGKRIDVFKDECDLSVNDIKYDQMNIITIISKHYQYSNELIDM